MARCESFPPVISKNTRLLILGSMPGVNSLHAAEYYAHPQNKLWDIIADVYGITRDLAYQTRLDQLLKHRVGLWDVLQNCYREGSLDSAIKEAKINDFTLLFKQHQAIQRIVLNGRKAADLFQRHVQHLLPESVTVLELPSTSPAHARLTYREKLARWRSALEFESKV